VKRGHGNALRTKGIFVPNYRPSTPQKNVFTDHKAWVAWIVAKRQKSGTCDGFFYNQDEGNNGKAAMIQEARNCEIPVPPKALTGHK